MKNTVEEKVSEKEEVSSGEALFTLENVSSTAKYDNLASQHRNYEELMLSLFEMYQSGTLKAPSDGTVSGIEKDSTLLLSNAEGVSIELLANSPDGNDEISYNNYIGKIIFFFIIFICSKTIGKMYIDTMPKSMEDCGQSAGYILYEWKLPESARELKLIDCFDRAIVFVNGERVGTYELGVDEQALFEATICKPNARLQVLVENMGRINYGSYVMDKKGIKLIGELVPYIMNTGEFNSPGMLEILKEAGKLGMTANFHGGNRETVVPVLENCPGLNVILAHPGEPWGPDGAKARFDFVLL